jgi:hypothetical protein
VSVHSRIGFVLFLLLVFWSCAKPPSLPSVERPYSETVYINNDLSSESKVCVELEMAYDDRRYACVTVKEIRWQIRGRRSTW